MTVPTVLAVDDGPDDLMLLGLACAAAEVRFNLQTVDSGDAAIAYVEGKRDYVDREKFPFPSLVLLDVKMPCLSGFTVLSWLRAAEQCRRLPVVMFTSSVQIEDRARALELGANAFVAKPIGFVALQSFVRALDALVSSSAPAADLRSLEMVVQANPLASIAGSLGSNLAKM